MKSMINRRINRRLLIKIPNWVHVRVEAVFVYRNKIDTVCIHFSKMFEYFNKTSRFRDIKISTKRLIENSSY